MLPHATAHLTDVRHARATMSRAGREGYELPAVATAVGTGFSESSCVGPQPFQSLPQPLVKDINSRAGLQMQLAAQSVQPQPFHHLRRRHRIGQVLLVGKDEDRRVAQLVLAAQAVEFVVDIVETVPVVGIHHDDHPLGALVVVAPQRADLVAPPHVPHGEVGAVEDDGLNVEADGGDGGDDLPELQTVQNGGLAGRIEPHHEYAPLSGFESKPCGTVVLWYCVALWHCGIVVLRYCGIGVLRYWGIGVLRYWGIGVLWY